jgi:hypothetical protein
MFAWLADVPALGVSDGRSQTEFQVADPPQKRGATYHPSGEVACVQFSGAMRMRRVPRLPRHLVGYGDGGPSPADQGRVGPSGLPPDPTLLAALFRQTLPRRDLGKDWRNARSGVPGHPDPSRYRNRCGVCIPSVRFGASRQPGLPRHEPSLLSRSHRYCRCRFPAGFCDYQRTLGGGFGSRSHETCPRTLAPWRLARERNGSRSR